VQLFFSRKFALGISRQCGPDSKTPFPIPPTFPLNCATAESELRSQTTVTSTPDFFSAAKSAFGMPESVMTC
jgi:hypothetical protein